MRKRGATLLALPSASKDLQTEAKGKTKDGGNEVVKRKVDFKSEEHDDDSGEILDSITTVLDGTAICQTSSATYGYLTAIRYWTT